MGSEQGSDSRTDRDAWQAQIPLLTAAAQGSEAVAAWGAAVTAPAEDVGFALALPSLRLALAAAGALRVALAGCGQQGRCGPGSPCPHPAHTLPALCHHCPA